MDDVLVRRELAENLVLILIVSADLAWKNHINTGCYIYLQSYSHVQVY